ncbi:unnamed protein product [Lepidochelys kempii]
MPSNSTEHEQECCSMITLKKQANLQSFLRTCCHLYSTDEVLLSLKRNTQDMIRTLYCASPRFKAVTDCFGEQNETMDQNDQTWLSGYWKWVGPIAVGSFCLFIFVIYKRGVQLKNPFYGIWTTDVGMKLALMAFIAVAGICLCLYFLFLCFLVFKVFQNFHGKQLSLPPMKMTCRIQYQVGKPLSNRYCQLPVDGGWVRGWVRF